MLLQGFNDPEYRKRRAYISELAFRYKQWVRSPKKPSVSLQIPCQTLIILIFFCRGDPLPVVEYTAEEISTWWEVYHTFTDFIRGEEFRVQRCDNVVRLCLNWRREVYQQLRSIYPSLACRQFLDGLQQLERECGYGEDRIPQLREVSAFLKGDRKWESSIWRQMLKETL